MYVCMYVCARVCMCVRECECVCVCVYVRVRARILAIKVSLNNWRIHLHISFVNIFFMKLVGNMDLFYGLHCFILF